MAVQEAIFVSLRSCVVVARGGALPLARSFLRVRVLPCWVAFSGCGWVGGTVERVFLLSSVFLARVVSVARSRLRCFLNGSRGIVNAFVLQSCVRTVPLPGVSRSLIQELLKSFDACSLSNSGFLLLFLSRSLA